MNVAELEKLFEPETCLLSELKPGDKFAFMEHTKWPPGHEYRTTRRGWSSPFNDKYPNTFIVQRQEENGGLTWVLHSNPAFKGDGDFFGREHIVRKIYE